MVIKKAGLAFLISAGLSFSQIPEPEAINIFQDKAFLVEKINLELGRENSINLVLPEYFSMESSYITVQDKKCSIRSLSESEIPKSIKDKKSNLENQLSFLEDRLNVLDFEISTLRNLSISDKKDVNYLNLVADKLFKKLQERRTVLGLINSVKKDIEKLSKIYGRCYLLKINCDSPVKTALRVSFPVSVKSFHRYTVYADTYAGKVTVVNTLVVKQSSGIDLKNINLNYYRYVRSPYISPPSVYPAKRITQLKVEKREYVRTKTKSYFSVKNISIPDSRKVLITLSQDVFGAEFSVFVDGYSSVTPFLKAEFTPDKYFPPSDAFIYVDGIYIGKVRLKPLVEGKKNSLFFGEDQFVDVSKEKIKDFSEESIFGKKITTKKWRYSLKNNHTERIKVVIFDRVPVSHTEKVKIQPFSTLKWKELKNDGTVVFEIFLSPEEKISFDFGYKIERSR